VVPAEILHVAREDTDDPTNPVRRALDHRPLTGELPQGSARIIGVAYPIGQLEHGIDQPALVAGARHNTLLPGHCCGE